MHIPYCELFLLCLYTDRIIKQYLFPMPNKSRGDTRPGSHPHPCGPLYNNARKQTYNCSLWCLSTSFTFVKVPRKSSDFSTHIWMVLIVWVYGLCQTQSYKVQSYSWQWHQTISIGVLKGKESTMFQSSLRRF